ncbi:MAG: histidinol-phosphatase HisJ family protein [Ruminococcaceae bacterium]|nr:histidinol-phosphatase HisJ family protein [Oscillospiraceae bacterium]
MELPRYDLHVHSRFCDGKDTPEEMTLEAIRRGIKVLGFSGHSPSPHDASYCMSQERIPAYRAEILRLRERYADRIDVYCGIEQDFYSPPISEPFDYVIGSVHYLKREDAYLPIDLSADRLLSDVRAFFGGDIYRYLKCYYETVAALASMPSVTIVGHFDLVEKFNEGNRLFDPSDYRYRRPMLDALDALLEGDKLFEINTGAIARGYRSVPYPAAYILRRIAEKQGRVMINGDTHRKENLLVGYGEAVMLARACGVGGLTVLQKGKWTTLPWGRV